MKYILLTLTIVGSCKAHAAGLSLVLILGAWGAVIAVLLDAIGRKNQENGKD